mmetsp:Transcript_29611/g.91571  ORF Transcript_29611/g.91571 Transcript_29611/m.91571 type:complete len:209 (-) Transcript_29611:128-754(-)
MRCTGHASTKPASRWTRDSTESDSSMPSSTSLEATAARIVSQAASAAASSRRPPAGPPQNFKNLVRVRGSESHRRRSAGGSSRSSRATAHQRSRRVGRSNLASKSRSPAAKRAAWSRINSSVGPYAGTLRRPAGLSTTTTARDACSTRSRVARSNAATSTAAVARSQQAMVARERIEIPLGLVCGGGVPASGLARPGLRLAPSAFCRA